MKIHLVDGTYELFRSYFATPPSITYDGRQVGAVRGLINTLLSLLKSTDVTHVACAFDHVIESFRNEMFDGYKTGDGVPRDLLDQFELAERAASTLGIIVWPMIEFEADDVLATAAERWRKDPRVDQIVICSPDKDLTQMVHGDRVTCLDRRRGILLDEKGVEAKFGISPASIPDYLALVGDKADGIPGIPRWGAKSTAQVLKRYVHLEDIPVESSYWDILPRGAEKMALTLKKGREEAFLYRSLTTLRTDVPLSEHLEDLLWRGAYRETYTELCGQLDFGRLAEAPHVWRD